MLRVKGISKLKWGLISFGACALLAIAGPAQATFPGENGKIVVSAYDGSNDYELYEAFPGMLNLTNNSDVGEQNPEWNSEGSLLVAQCQQLDGSQPEICTYDDAGNLVETLTSSTGSYAPTWNKAGDKIAFIQYDGHDNEIYKIDSTGTPTPEPVTATNRSEYRPKWSPNGKWILFTRTVNGNNRLMRMRADGSSPVVLTKNFREGYSWSPDSKLIIFDRVVNQNSGNSELFTMKPDGSAQTRISFTRTRQESLPTYSPNGKQAAFIVGHEAEIKVTKENLSTGDRTYVLHAPGNLAEPAWQSVIP